ASLKIVPPCAILAADYLSATNKKFLAAIQEAATETVYWLITAQRVRHENPPDRTPAPNMAFSLAN
ncbi:hypothetical protein, partial [Rhizobium sp. ICMP 5592]|uniref:hypothetical protein n=1 Tax=Rhizobium sp. ICMP 5592 TaxID=2292445 RepID=UPI001AEE39A9